MKVPSPIRYKQAVRGLVAVLLVWFLAAGGAAAPFMASAEEAPALSPAPSSIETPTILSTQSPLPEVLAVAALPANVTPAPAPVVKRKKLTVQQVIVRTGRAAHLSKAEIDALLWIAKRESNYHPRSHSRSECHGLFQLSKGMAHGRRWTDPVWNTKRAIRYMKGRYGGVLRAKAFWLSHHWY